MNVTFIDDPSEKACKPIENGVLEYGLSEINGDLPKKYAFHACDSGKLIGGAVGRVHLSQCYLDNIWVSEAFRSKGVAKIIHAEVVAYAEMCGCKKIQLNTLNKKAVKLYQQLGYQELAVIKGYADGFDLHYMAKEII